MYCSCFAKKSTKRRRLKGTFRKGRTDGMIATGNHGYCRFAARSTTLKKPLRAHRQPVSKNVPIFEHLPLKILQVFSLQTPENRNIFGCRMAMRRGFPKGAHFRSAPLADFFGYFLVRYKKVTFLHLHTLQKGMLFCPSLSG